MSLEIRSGSLLFRLLIKLCIECIRNLSYMAIWNLIARLCLAWEHSSSPSPVVMTFFLKLYNVALHSYILLFKFSGSILLLTSAAVAWDYCPKEGTCSQFVPLTPAHYVQIILSLQTSILLPVCLAYSGSYNNILLLLKPFIQKSYLLYSENTSVQLQSSIAWHIGRADGIFSLKKPSSFWRCWSQVF